MKWNISGKIWVPEMPKNVKKNAFKHRNFDGRLPVGSKQDMMIGFETTGTNKQKKNLEIKSQQQQKNRHKHKINHLQLNEWKINDREEHS